jgi:hypothetical protein
VDTAFGVYADITVYTWKLALILDSANQEVNTRISIEAEMNDINDEIGMIIWVRTFIKAQGFPMKTNAIYQDNQSRTKLSNNEQGSSGKRTQYFDVKLLYMIDLIEKGQVQITYCPTKAKIAGYKTKVSVGLKFIKFRDLVLNLSDTQHEIGQQECVGKQTYEHNKLER